MLPLTDAPSLASEEPVRIDGIGDPDPAELPGTTYLFPKYGVVKGKSK